MGTILRMMHSQAAGSAAEEEQGRQGRLIARSARAHLIRLRGDHASHGYYPQNDALTIGGVRGRRVREEHRRGSRPRVGAGETRGVPRDGETRREVPRPRGERLRGVVHRQPAGTRLVVTHDGRVAADASPEPGPHRAVACLVATPLPKPPYLSRLNSTLHLKKKKK